MCQKWDSNPRLHSETRSPVSTEGLEPWVWRLRPLGHPDTVLKHDEVEHFIYTHFPMNFCGYMGYCIYDISRISEYKSFIGCVFRPFPQH